MIIPHEQISADTLYNMVESFVLREGTDYGMDEVPIETKVEEVIAQIKTGCVVIQYSEEYESINIVTKESIGL